MKENLNWENWTPYASLNNEDLPRHSVSLLRKVHGQNTAFWRRIRWLFRENLPEKELFEFPGEPGVPYYICHIACRAMLVRWLSWVHCRARVSDGMYMDMFAHSWISVHDGNKQYILDVLPVGHAYPVLRPAGRMLYHGRDIYKEDCFHPNFTAENLEKWDLAVAYLLGKESRGE